MMAISILMFPFIQFGLSWWISISSFGCLAILFQTLRSHAKLEFKIDIGTSCVVYLLAVTYFWQDFGDLHLFLRISRETFILVLLIHFIQKFSPKKTPEMALNIDRVLFAVIVFEFLLVLIQLLFLRRGMWVGPSASWLAGRGNLIPTLVDLKYSKLRPSGTFSEPSYLGIVCLSILILVSRKPLDSKKARITYFLSIVTIILSQSKSALFFALCILAVQGSRKRFIRNRSVNTFILPLAIFLLLPFLGLISSTLRASRGSISIQSRIFEPLSYSLNFLFSHPLGIPFYKRILEYVDPNRGLTWEAISHNSIFNFIFSYGVVGFGVILRIVVIAKRDLVLHLYLLALLLQNGSFLDFDKLFMVTVVLSTFRTEVGKLDV